MIPLELIKRLEAAGWVEVRQSGSHKIFKHPDNPDNISVPVHSKKDLKPGLVSKLLKKAGLKWPSPFKGLLNRSFSSTL